MSSYILNVIKASDVQSWIQTNAVGSVKPRPQDSWRAYLADNGGVGQNFRDLEMSFLSDEGVAEGGTLRDRWAIYLTAESGVSTPEKARAKYK